MTTDIKPYIGIQFAAGWRSGDLRTAVEALAGPTGGTVLIPMPCCGQSFKYATIEDIPTETTPCPCGTEGMYVVKYEEA